MEKMFDDVQVGNLVYDSFSMKFSRVLKVDIIRERFGVLMESYTDSKGTHDIYLDSDFTGREYVINKGAKQRFFWYLPEDIAQKKPSIK